MLMHSGVGGNRNTVAHSKPVSKHCWLINITYLIKILFRILIKL